MANKKRGLGKGLSALIPDEPIDEILNSDDKNYIMDIDISLIKPNENQPRKKFNEKSLDELKESIKTYGVIQPVIVRKTGKVYEIVAGERRWKASKEAGLKSIPCIVKDIEDFEATKLALIENLQREDLNPVEEANAFKDLMDQYKLTQEEIAKIVGKSRSYIANSIRLLNLDDEVKDYLSKGEISSGHGKAILAIDDKKKQKKVARDIIDKKLNVRDAESLVKDIKKNTPSRVEKDPYILDIEENLISKFGTKVKITQGNNKGKVEIEYYSDDDLNRILEILMN
jgi:ParB family chromosome partitioning protein